MNDPKPTDVMSAAEIDAVVKDDVIARAIIEAYLEETETDEVMRSGVDLAKAVSTMIGLDVATDGESAIADLRWIGRIVDLAADHLEAKLVYLGEIA